MPILGNFIFVVNTGTLNGQVFFLIPATETAGAVRSSKLVFVPHKPPDNRCELFFIGIERPALLFCISFCPFEHFFFICMFFCHNTRPHPYDILVTICFFIKRR